MLISRIKRDHQQWLWSDAPVASVKTVGVFFWREKVEEQSHGGCQNGLGDVKYNDNKFCTKKNTGLDNSFAHC